MLRSRNLVGLAAVGSMVLLLAIYLSVAAVEPGNEAFQTRWERTDDPVLNGLVQRTWIWGPEANYPLQTEPYSDSPGGMRTVQYFDKSRMEINNPNGNPDDLFYVTNGLLVVELMTGQLQLGDNSFEQYSSSMANVAGDADDPTGPTYTTLAALRNLPALPDGALITQRVNRAGVVTDDPSLAAQGITAAERLTVPGIDHQIAGPFWDFMNSSGTVYQSGQYVAEALFTNAYYATGFPITEAYWANVKVGGTYRDVLMQCFERRCLTYTPGNPPGFATEAGNVGQHYYFWRYTEIEATPTATEPGATATGTASATGTPSATMTATMQPTATTVPPSTYNYASKFGQPSDPARSLAVPIAVAFDSAGNIYVTEQNGHRVLKFDPNGIYLTQWGSMGANAGQFAAPNGITVVQTMNGEVVYVADTGNDRIQGFDTNGQYLSEWGSAGAGMGQFNSPNDVAADSAGNIYVTDLNNGLVQKFNSAGVYQTQWDGSAGLAGALVWPRHIDVDGNDNVYVVDSGNHRVQVFDANGNYLRSWGIAGTNDGEFDTPFGIAVSADNSRVYVSEANGNRVQVFGTQGNYQSTWGGLPVGSSQGQLNNPLGIALDGNGALYVADNVNQRIQIVSAADFSYIGQLTGDSRGRFDDPYGLTLDNAGNILVVDQGLAQVKVFTSAGAYVAEWGEPGSELAPNLPLLAPVDAAVDSAGNIYVTDYNNDRVVKYNAMGQELTSWGGAGNGNGQFMGALGIAVDASDNVYVSDEGNHRIQKFSSTGSYIDAWGTMGNGDGEFNQPGDVTVWGNSVYVADFMNHRVQEFDLDGNYVRQWGSFGTGDGQFNIPAFIAVDSQGYIFVSDALNNRVQKFTPTGAYYAQFGSTGTGDGQFMNPLGIAIDGLGNVLVVDGINHRVQVFSPA